jgi:hypothetical protein
MPGLLGGLTRLMVVMVVVMRSLRHVPSCLRPRRNIRSMTTLRLITLVVGSLAVDRCSVVACMRVHSLFMRWLVIAARRNTRASKVDFLSMIQKV